MRTLAHPVHLPTGPSVGLAQYHLGGSVTGDFSNLCGGDGYGVVPLLGIQWVCVLHDTQVREHNPTTNAPALRQRTLLWPIAESLVSRSRTRHVREPLRPQDASPGIRQCDRTSHHHDVAEGLWRVPCGTLGQGLRLHGAAYRRPRTTRQRDARTGSRTGQRLPKV
jgi:hypothetical protein